MESELPRKLAVILFADVVGFSGMMRTDESNTFVKVRNYLDQFSREIEKFSGRVVKTSGDAVMAEFNTATHAVQCALKVQENFAAQNQDTPENERLLFRIGINLGDVIVDGDDLFGDGVNVASRLEGLAPAGGVCISDAVRSSLGDKSGISYVDMGEQQVKNIDAPIRCFQISTGASKPVPSSSQHSDENLEFLSTLMVQPFEFIGSSGEYDYLGRGISDSVSNALTCFRNVTIVTEPGNPSANYVLNGSLQIAGNRIRISPVLSNSAGQKVWAEKLDRTLEDVFEIQDEICAIIAGYLGEAIWQDRAREISDKNPRDFTAVDWTYRAMALAHQLTEPESEKAKFAAQNAMDLAPNALMPKLLMAWIIYIRLSQRWLPATDGNRKKIMNSIEELLRMDPLHPDIHRLASRVHAFLGQNRESKAHSERALQLNPYDGDVLVMHSFVLTQTGHAGEAIPWIEKALRINPSPPGYYRQALFNALYWAGDQDSALGELNKCEGAILAHYQYIAIAILYRTNNIQDAKSRISRFQEIRPAMSLQDAAALHTNHTDQTAVNRMLEELRTAGVPDQADNAN